MKKLIAVATAAFILLSSATVFAAGQKVTLTIEEAKKLAVEKSKQAVIDDLNIRVKEIILKDSKYDLTPDSGPSLDNAYKVGVEPIEVETNLEVAKRNKAENIQTLNYNVYKSAADILLIKQQLDSEKQQLAILQDKYNIVKARFEQKQVIESEIYDADYAVESKKNAIEKVEDSLNVAKLELQKLLDMPVNEVLVDIRDEIKYIPYDKVDIEDIITKALDTNVAVYEKSQIVKMKEKNLENVNHYVKQGNSAYDSAYYDLEAARLDLQDARAGLENDIRNKYNKLLNGKGTVEIADKYASIMSKKFASTEIKYKKGMLNKESYLSEKEKYLDAVYQKYQAIKDFSVLKIEFGNLIS